MNGSAANAQDGLPEEGSIGARLRERAVPMLCTMAHSTQRGRAALGAADGAGVLLGLLRDPPYQVQFCLRQSKVCHYFDSAVLSGDVTAWSMLHMGVDTTFLSRSMFQVRATVTRRWHWTRWRRGWRRTRGGCSCASRSATPSPASPPSSPPTPPPVRETL